MLQDERDDGEELLVVAVFVSPVNLKGEGRASADEHACKVQWSI
jgi:hypothetical protein